MPDTEITAWNQVHADLTSCANWQQKKKAAEWHTHRLTTYSKSPNQPLSDTSTVSKHLLLSKVTVILASVESKTRGVVCVSLLHFLSSFFYFLKRKKRKKRNKTRDTSFWPTERTVTCAPRSSCSKLLTFNQLKRLWIAFQSQNAASFLPLISSKGCELRSKVKM